MKVVGRKWHGGNIDPTLPFGPEVQRMRDLAPPERAAWKPWLKVYGKKRGRIPGKETGSPASLSWGGSGAILGLRKVSLGALSQD